MQSITNFFQKISNNFLKDNEKFQTCKNISDSLSTQATPKNSNLTKFKFDKIKLIKCEKPKLEINIIPFDTQIFMGKLNEAVITLDNNVIYKNLLNQTDSELLKIVAENNSEIIIEAYCEINNKKENNTLSESDVFLMTVKRKMNQFILGNIQISKDDADIVLNNFLYNNRLYIDNNLNKQDMVDWEKVYFIFHKIVKFLEIYSKIDSNKNINCKIINNIINRFLIEAKESEKFSINVKNLLNPKYIKLNRQYKSKVIKEANNMKLLHLDNRLTYLEKKDFSPREILNKIVHAQKADFIAQNVKKPNLLSQLQENKKALQYYQINKEKLQNITSETHKIINNSQQKLDLKKQEITVNKFLSKNERLNLFNIEN